MKCTKREKRSTSACAVKWRAIFGSPGLLPALCEIKLVSLDSSVAVSSNELPGIFCSQACFSEMWSSVLLNGCIVVTFMRVRNTCFYALGNEIGLA